MIVVVERVVGWGNIELVLGLVVVSWGLVVVVLVIGLVFVEELDRLRREFKKL